MVGERRVALEGTFNFRDLGGYGTVHGRRVKWGEVYRSDNLSRLTDNAVGMIASMGIRLVCDLRSDGEAESRPNRLPENQGIETCHLPVVQGKIDGIAAFEKIKQRCERFIHFPLPKTHVLSAYPNPNPPKSFLLPVKGQVVGEFIHQDKSQ